MPIYTYRCDNCGVQFERQQSFDEARSPVVLNARRKPCAKFIRQSVLYLKGSGFYATDHRSPSGAGRSTTSPKNGEGEEKPTSTERLSQQPALRKVRPQAKIRPIDCNTPAGSVFVLSRSSRKISQMTMVRMIIHVNNAPQMRLT